MAHLTVSATKSEHTVCHSIGLDTFAIFSMCLFDFTLCSQTNPAFSQKHIFVCEKGWKCFGFHAKVPLWVHGSSADSADHIRVVIAAEKKHWLLPQRWEDRKKQIKGTWLFCNLIPREAYWAIALLCRTPDLLKMPAMPAPTQGFMTTHCHAPPKQFSKCSHPGGAA